MLMTSSLSQPMAPMHRISARRMSMPALWCFASSCVTGQPKDRRRPRCPGCPLARGHTRLPRLQQRQQQQQQQQAECG